jgi:hypothetical protein
MAVKLQKAEKEQSTSKNFCTKCFPKSFPMEAGTQAVVSTSSVSVQAPPDNEALLDPVQGYTPFSAITEVRTNKLTPIIIFLLLVIIFNFCNLKFVTVL